MNEPTNSPIFNWVAPAKDFPYREIAKAMPQRIADGFDFYMKWTCEGCGQRLTSSEPNVMFEEGCCDCGHVTNIKKRGCNYLLTKAL